MIVEIRKNRLYNAGCWICGKVQEGGKAQPYLVYHKDDNEKRGHQEQVCSMECAKVLVERYQKQ